MPKMFVMVALPRSGKSTYVDKYLHNIPRISADQLRLLIYGRRYLAEKEHLVWWVRDIMLRALMQQELDVVIDQTNITRARRRELIRLAEEYGYTTVAVVLERDIGTCKERAVETGQEDLIPVIEEYALNYEPVSESEGFNEIIRA